ncbi:MAG: IS30 family transposase [Prevotella sp.]|nr:IS30 family transposase [Prevotella sp.]
MEKLDTGKQAIPLADAVVRLLKNCPIPVRTITTDNGTEFAAHEKITSELKAKVYFTHPYSSWEKETIENTNGLIRLYIPKKTDLKEITRGYVRMVVEKLNNRPRKKNGFIKPIDMIKEKNI